MASQAAKIATHERVEKFDPGKHRLQWIPVNKISVVWASAQRPFDPRHAKAIADNFDPDMFGHLSVTMPNGDGIYHAIDGQHRRDAVARLWGPSERVPCVVYPHVDPQRAAQLFVQINTSRKRPQPIDIFKVSVTAGSPTEMAVNAIVRKLGYRIETGARPGHISCVAALLSVHRRGGDTLESTLRMIRATWGDDPHACSAPLVRGYGLFIGEFGKKIDEKRLAHVISSKYTPGKFLGLAKSAKDVFNGNLAQAIRRVLFDHYNRGLRDKAQLVEHPPSEDE